MVLAAGHDPASQIRSTVSATSLATRPSRWPIRTGCGPLIGAFAHGNPTQFNRTDGAGYDFVADTVLALDPKNPQLAARLATAFRTWRTLEKGRRAKAEAALQPHQGALRIFRATWQTSSNARLAAP